MSATLISSCAGKKFALRRRFQHQRGAPKAESEFRVEATSQKTTKELESERPPLTSSVYSADDLKLLLRPHFDSPAPEVDCKLSVEATSEKTMKKRIEFEKCLSANSILQFGEGSITASRIPQVDCACSCEDFTKTATSEDFMKVLDLKKPLLISSVSSVDDLNLPLRPHSVAPKVDCETSVGEISASARSSHGFETVPLSEYERLALWRRKLGEEEVDSKIPHSTGSLASCVKKKWALRRKRLGFPATDTDLCRSMTDTDLYSRLYDTHVSSKPRTKSTADVKDLLNVCWELGPPEFSTKLSRDFEC
jgi:hypothetical protein